MILFNTPDPAVESLGLSDRQLIVTNLSRPTLKLGQRTRNTPQSQEILVKMCNSLYFYFWARLFESRLMLTLG